MSRNAQLTSEITARGTPFVASDLEAKAQLARLVDVEPREGVETVLALFMLREFSPQRFKSDEAFKFQLVRRVRGLSDVNAARYHDARTKKDKRVYRDLRPRTTRTLAEYLTAAFGRAGLHIARRERERIERQGQERQALDKALMELK